MFDEYFSCRQAASFPSRLGRHSVYLCFPVLLIIENLWSCSFFVLTAEKPRVRPVSVIFSFFCSPYVFTDAKLNAIAGIDSRGYYFAILLAHELKLPFVAIRKRGKLPGDVVEMAYGLEYGASSFYCFHRELRAHRRLQVPMRFACRRASWKRETAFSLSTIWWYVSLA